MTEDTSAGAEMPIACCACNHVIRRTDDDTGLGIVTKEWRECASCGQEFISKKIHTTTVERLARTLSQIRKLADEGSGKKTLEKISNLCVSTILQIEYEGRKA